MPPNDHLNLFTEADITRPSEQEKYSRYIDTAVSQGSIAIGKVIGVGGAPRGLYVVDDERVTHIYESGTFKKRIEFKRVVFIPAITDLAATDSLPTDASNKFEGRSWTNFSITGRNSSGQVVLAIVWGGLGSDISSKRIRDHIFKLIKEAMAEFLTMHVGLKPLTARGKHIVAELEDGYSSLFRGVNDAGAWLFGPQYVRAQEVWQERLARMEPQWTLHVEMKLYH